MMIALIVLAVVASIYLFLLGGRTGKKELEQLRKWRYAHRGFHGNGVPENSMEAFRLALEAGYGIELDVHLLADGNLGVMHDSALLRTTGEPGKIEALTTDRLSRIRLEGTEQTIPEFRQVLELFAGKAPMIIELKTDGGNYARLTETLCRMLEGYSGPYCVESFDPRCIRWLRKNRPDIVRGQLSENFLRSDGSGVNWPLRFAMTFLLSNGLTRPDFVAYRFAHRNHVSVWLCRKLFRVQGVSWTIRTPEEFDTACREGWIPIFEGFRPK